MNAKSYFIILGPIVDDEPTYWNVDAGWTVSEKHASHLPKDVLTRPLPEGGVAIKECKEDGTIIAIFDPSPSEGMIFEKRI